MDFDVAIVGYGPTGLALAYWLGKAGHNTVVIERWPDLYTLPRAGHVDGEVMRLFQKMGIAEIIARDSAIMKTAVIRGWDGAEISRAYAEESDQGWQSRYSLYQPNLESALDAIVRGTGRVTVLQGWLAESVERSEDNGVRIQIASGAGSDGTWTPTGHGRVVRARWLIGADGANSIVRKAGTSAEIVPGIVTKGKDPPYIPNQPPQGILTELRRMYYETAQCSNPVALGALRKLVPVSQILYGSDFGFRTNVETVRGLRTSGIFSPRELRAVESGNAQALFG